jgi:hypothetical protein
MNNSQITTYTYNEISAILKTIQNCVKEGNYILSRNDKRKENIDFFTEYNLTTAKIKDIILKIKTIDFCYGLRNEHLGYEHEILYVFCPQIELPYGNVSEVVDIYSKFNIVNDERVIVISFHKRNYPISYLFSELNEEEDAL